MKAEAVFAGAFVAATAWVADANAFCRAVVDDNHGLSADGCPAGAPLYWPNRCVGYSINSAASSQIDFSTATAIIDKAFSSWTDALCDGGSALPSIQVVDLGATDVSTVEYHEPSSGMANTNLFVFRDQSWPHLESSVNLALPTVTYLAATGEILDVDTEFNTSENDFTVGDDNIQIDFLSIATNNIGHFLGFADSPQPDSVMTPGYTKGSKALRNPSADDLTGVCGTFPANGTRVTAKGVVQAQQCNLEVANVPASVSSCPSSTVAGCTVSRSTEDEPGTRWTELGFFVAMGIYGVRRASRSLPPTSRPDLARDRRCRACRRAP